MSTYVSLPPTGAARFVIPRHDPKAAAAGLQFFARGGGGRSRRGVIKALRLGAASVFPSSSEANNLAVAVTEAVAKAGFADPFVIHLGPPRSNRKPVAVILRNGEPQAIVKVGVTELTDRLIANESQALAEMSLVPHGSILTPELLGSGACDSGRHFMVQSILPHVGRPPRLDEVRTATDAIVASGPQEIALLGRGPWAQRIQALVDRLPETVDTAAVAQGLRELGDGPEVVHGRAHGDFSPWNCVADSQLAIWDWERYATAVPAGFDLAHFAVFDAVAAGESFATATAQLDRVLNAGHTPYLVQTSLIGAYLVDIGARFVTDDQRAAGAESGRVAEWLPQALRAVTER